MPLRPTESERGSHAKRRVRELEDALARAEEGGAFDGLTTRDEWEARAAELIPSGFSVRRFEAFHSLEPWWAVYWYSGG